MKHEVPCEVAWEEEESTPSVSSSLDPQLGGVPRSPTAQKPEAAAQPDEASEEAADQEERTPKAGRRRRRRRHRRRATSPAGLARDSSDDESGPSQESANLLGGASPSRNVVTWSDLGGDSVLKKAPPVDRFVQSAAPQTPQQPPCCPTIVPIAWQAPLAAQVWPVPWPCAAGAVQPQGLHGKCWAVPMSPQACVSSAAVPTWTEKDSVELRQWLCNGFSGGMPGLPELAHVLDSMAGEAYED